VVTNEETLGVRSWITLIPKPRANGKEEALCLWLNSTVGLLLRILHANRPYLGRSAIPHEVARELPVLDIDSLTDRQLQAALHLFGELRTRRLQGFAHMATDRARRELDHRLFAEVLGYEVADELDSLAQALNREPTVTTRH